jgi:hypothetical protein
MPRMAGHRRHGNPGTRFPCFISIYVSEKAISICTTTIKDVKTDNLEQSNESLIR